MRPWAVVRFCLATVLSCLDVAVAFLGWVHWATAQEPGSVQLIATVGALLAMVLGPAGIFFGLVCLPKPVRRTFRKPTFARSCFATLLGCCTGLILFVFWFVTGYATDSVQAEDAVTAGVVLAMVFCVVGLFSALVLSPARSDPAVGTTAADGRRVGNDPLR